MQIGDLAQRAGVSTRTIRYYEELGLIGPEERSGGGFAAIATINYAGCKSFRV
jgi:hypothetical protein